MESVFFERIMKSGKQLVFCKKSAISRMSGVNGSGNCEILLFLSKWFNCFIAMFSSFHPGESGAPPGRVGRSTWVSRVTHPGGTIKRTQRAELIIVMKREYHYNGGGCERYNLRLLLKSEKTAKEAK